MKIRVETTPCGAKSRFSFPAGHLTRFVGPHDTDHSKLMYRVQRPKRPTPSLVLYNDGQHVYCEPHLPWPGDEREWRWLRFRDYQRIGSCPNQNMRHIGVRLRGHRYQRNAIVVINVGFLKEYILSLGPNQVAYLIEFLERDAIFVRPFVN